MLLTKETMVHIAVVTAVTGGVFAVIFSSGATSQSQLEIQVFAKAEFTNDMIFLTYSIHNTGDYPIYNVTVAADCCSHLKELYNEDATSLLHVLESKKYMDVIPVTNFTAGDEIIIQFAASDTFGNQDVDIMTVILQ